MTVDRPERELQLAYYAEQGVRQLDPAPGGQGLHDLPLSMLMGFMRWQPVQSLLDVGAGTGRALSMIRDAFPTLELHGIEPSPALRRASVEKWGLAPAQLIYGDASCLPFPDRSIDIVCSFGILHHLRYPRRALEEYCRVAKVAVMVSDANVFGQGSPGLRVVKRMIRGLGLWRTVNLVRSRGKGYFWSEGDGIFYSYSLFDDIDVLERRFAHVLSFNPNRQSRDHYRQSPQIVALGHSESFVDPVGRLPA